MEENLKANVILEILGTPKDHVENTLQQVIKKIKEYEGIKVITEKSNEAIEKEFQKIKVWSTFVELDISFKNIDRLTSFCYDFMPSSVEIYKPQQIVFPLQDLNNLINDLITRLHQYDQRMKTIHAQNMLLQKELQKRSK